MSWLRLIVVLLCFVPAVGRAADLLPQGIQVGAAIPHTLEAPDHTGARRDFQSLKGEKGLVLLFNRSVLW